MFLGEFLHTVDEKGRMTVPSRFRPYLAEGLVITRGIDRCLVIYPMPAWKQLSEQVSGLPVTDRRARAFRRLVFAAASHAMLDSHGRVLIPPRLRAYGELDGEAVVTGLATHVEVWNPELWSKEREQVEGADVDIEQWAALGI